MGIFWVACAAQPQEPWPVVRVPAHAGPSGKEQVEEESEGLAGQKLLPFQCPVVLVEGCCHCGESDIKPHLAEDIGVAAEFACSCQGLEPFALGHVGIEGQRGVWPPTGVGVVGVAGVEGPGKVEEHGCLVLEAFFGQDGSCCEHGVATGKAQCLEAGVLRPHEALPFALSGCFPGTAAGGL
eukprot:8520905-Lingulodinium_polyedra.AAC.1